MSHTKESQLKMNLRWIERHAYQYAGQWVAVHRGHLLMNAHTRKELDEMVHKALEKDDDVIYFKVPEVVEKGE